MPVIEVKNFVKEYNGTAAVSGITFDVNQGELFGLIGPDGAGKTTLIRSLATLLIPTSGSVHVNGLEVTLSVSEIRSQIGYMPQRFSLYQDLTVEQNLHFFAELFQVKSPERERRFAQLYQFSRLAPFKKRRAGALSGGMKQKLALSCALIHTPKTLILDEPTFGVDPVSRQEFWDILKSLKAEGTTISVSTAYMDEATLCDRVALIFEGQIKALGSPLQLQKAYPYPLYRIQGSDLQSLSNYFHSLSNVHTIQLFGDALHVAFSKNPSAREWQTWEKSSRDNLTGWTSQNPSIEDIFLDLMHKEKDA